MSFGDMNHDDPNYITCDMEADNAQDCPEYQTSGDIRDIAETIKDLIPGIDGEALSEELANLAEEVRCMEDNSPHIWYSEGPAEIKMLKNRVASGAIYNINVPEEDEE